MDERFIQLRKGDQILASIAKSKPQSWSSAFLAAIIFVFATAATAGDEVAVGAPFIFMKEVFGWWPGFFISMLLWLSVGYFSLVVIDLVWPRIKDSFAALNHGWVLLLIGVISACTSVFILFLLRDEVSQLSLKIVGLIIATIIIILLLTVVIKIGEKFLRTFVKTVTEMTGQFRFIMKPIAILLVLVYMGPVLSWALLSPIGVSRKSIYYLTILAAPLFTSLWYPFYNGTWDTIMHKLLQG